MQPGAVQPLLDAKSDVNVTDTANVSPFDVLWAIHHHYAVFHIGSHLMYCISCCIMAPADPDVMMVIVYDTTHDLDGVRHTCAYR